MEPAATGTVQYSVKRLLVYIFLCAGALASAQVVPPTHAKTLKGSVVTFPQTDSPKALLLLVGFSHESSKQCDKWNGRLKASYLNDSHVAYYELADFQGVPSFVMWMILHGMRRAIPEDEQSHFVLLYSDEDKWKKLAGYMAPQDAYLIVADAGGHVLWQTHGEPNDAKYSEMQAALAK